MALACGMSYGAGLCTYRLTREARPAPKPEPRDDVIEGDYSAQPRPQLQRIGPGHWQLTTAEVDAQDIYQRVYLARLPATRDAIRTATNIMSNARITAALNVLAAEHLVTPEAGAGKQRSWIYDDEQ